MYDHLFELRKTNLVTMSVLHQAKHCSKHQKSWVQPKSWEILLPKKLSSILLTLFKVCASAAPVLTHSLLNMVGGRLSSWAFTLYAYCVEMIYTRTLRNFSRLFFTHKNEKKI